MECHTVGDEVQDCVHNKCTSLLVDLGLGLPDIYTHQMCSNNENISLRNRHLVNKLAEPTWLDVRDGDTVFLQPDADVYGGHTQQEVMDIRARIAREWVAGRQITPRTYADEIMRFTGPRRAKLHKANHDNRWAPPNTAISAFIKADMYDLETANTKPPRMIQARGAPYNLELGVHLGPAEHELLAGPGLGPTGTPMCSKGMTPEERGEIMQRKANHFFNPVAVCMDYSAFDSTQFPHILRQEHDVWKMLCPTLLGSLLDDQINNRGRTQSGITYTTCGTRMSGDRNTGGGNSVTNILNFLTICEIAGVVAEYICDGDDSVAWMEACDVDRFLTAAKALVHCVFGMLLKDCTVVTNPDGGGR